MIDYNVFMRMAIGEARRGIKEGNRGYGAVMLRGSTVIARSHATTTTEDDVTAHAEMKVIRLASKKLKGRRLEDCTLVATDEPCPMCAAATAWAGVGRVVYGASREDTRSISNANGLSPLPSKGGTGASPEVIAGVLREECLALHGPRD